MYEDGPTPDEALATAQRRIAEDFASLDAAVRARDLLAVRFYADDLLKRAYPFRELPLGITARVRAARAASSLLVNVEQQAILDFHREWERDARQRELSALYWHLGLE